MKIVGLIILIICGAMIGHHFYEQYSMKIKFLTQYISLVTLIKNNILYSADPLRKILENFRFQDPIKAYIDNCLKICDHLPFSEAWVKTFDETKMNFHLSEEEKNLILTFGKQLGTSDYISQAQNCAQHIKLLTPYLNNAIKNKNEKGKLPIILGVGMTIAMAILMI